MWFVLIQHLKINVNEKSPWFKNGIDRHLVTRYKRITITVYEVKGRPSYLVTGEMLEDGTFKACITSPYCDDLTEEIKLKGYQRLSVKGLFSLAFKQKYLVDFISIDVACFGMFNLNISFIKHCIDSILTNEISRECLKRMPIFVSQRRVAFLSRLNSEQLTHLESLTTYDELKSFIVPIANKSNYERYIKTPIGGECICQLMS